LVYLTKIEPWQRLVKLVNKIATADRDRQGSNVSPRAAWSVIERLRMLAFRWRSEGKGVSLSADPL